ncbi:hypothetical protein OH686_05220 [Pseudomonas sp. SO81]|nr:hypothetical protein OH686_05220 [Pseudomonas sp. SO81]
MSKTEANQPKPGRPDRPAQTGRTPRHVGQSIEKPPLRRTPR